MVEEAKIETNLVVMRGQPVHMGHIRLLDTAMEERPVVTVLGSIQEVGTSRNPHTYSERKKQLKNYFKSKWDRIFVLGMADTFSLDWPYRVLEKIQRVAPQYEIVKVYGGTEYDVSWFQSMGLEIEILGRNDPSFPYVSASMVRDMLMYKDARWMEHVPCCNWRMVAKKFNRLDMLEGLECIDEGSIGDEGSLDDRIA